MLLGLIMTPINLTYTAFAVKRVYRIRWISTLWRTALFYIAYAIVGNLQVWASIWITLTRLGR
jgi:hypothetical protein